MPLAPNAFFFSLHEWIIGVAVLIIAALQLWRMVRGEVRPRKCILCGEKISPEDYVHHLEICALTRELSRRNRGLLGNKD